MDLTSKIGRFDDVFHDEGWFGFQENEHTTFTSDVCVSALTIGWKERVFHEAFDNARDKLVEETIRVLENAGILDVYGLNILLCTPWMPMTRISEYKKFWKSRYGRGFLHLKENAVTEEIELVKEEEIRYAVICSLSVDELRSLANQLQITSYDSVLFLWKLSGDITSDFAKKVALSFSRPTNSIEANKSYWSELARLICESDGMVLELPSTFDIPDLQVNIFLTPRRMKEIFASSMAE